MRGYTHIVTWRHDSINCVQNTYLFWLSIKMSQTRSGFGTQIHSMFLTWDTKFAESRLTTTALFRPPYIIIKSVSFNKKICRCVWDSCHYCVCFGILHKITRHCVKDPYKNYYCPYTCKLHTTHFLVTALLHSSLNKSRLQQVWLLISKFVHSWIS